MCKRSYQSVKGFTLFEMLIALLVLSVGLLGVAALQTTGQQFNYLAYVRTQATFLAYDLMDRMRANRDNDPNTKNADEGSYASGGTFSDVGPSGKKDPNTSCDNKDCNPGQLTIYDLDNWFNQVRETLPGGDAKIEWSASEGYTITLRWQEDRSEKKDAAKKEQVWRMI